MKNQFAAVFAAGLTAAGLVSAEPDHDLPGRTYDRLAFRGESAAPGTALPAALLPERARRQLVLCMIGDSVTWAEEGDHFRSELLKQLPDLAFAGTHTALLGYSHAGEGGDSTVKVLRRIDDRERIPDAPYYHLLIGVNDASAAKTDDASEKVADGAVLRTAAIVDRLLARPGTRKVFLASVLPSPFGQDGGSTVRERTGSLINAKLRQNFQTLFPPGRVVWIEYEQPLRAELAEWKKRENLKGAHPTAKGYAKLAAIAAPVLKEHMRPECGAPASGKVGVEVVNLWRKDAGQSLPLIPGWYILSMRLKDHAKVRFVLESVCDIPQRRFRREYELSGRPGDRVEVEFMTGYQNFTYTLAPFQIRFLDGEAVDIQIEKMRPLRHASRYTETRAVDTLSPVAAGEVLSITPDGPQPQKGVCRGQDRRPDPMPQ